MKKKPSDAFRELGYSNGVEDSLEDEIIEKFEKIKHSRTDKKRKSKYGQPTFNQHMEALRQ